MSLLDLFFIKLTHILVNNSAKNCQALCLDCHREKTTSEKRQSKKR